MISMISIISSRNIMISPVMLYHIISCYSIVNYIMYDNDNAVVVAEQEREPRTRAAPASCLWCDHIILPR